LGGLLDTGLVEWDRPFISAILPTISINRG
jgi:hypothetical protein